MGFDPRDGDVDPDDLDGPSVDRRTTMKLLGATSLGGLVGLAGCAGEDGGDGGDGGDGDDGGDGGDGDVQTGGRLSVGWNVGEFEQIDPHFSVLTFSTQLIGNFFSGLLEIQPDFSLQGDLATDWDVQDGGETVTFDLVEDATFHNGDDFLAEDVKFSIRRVIEEETPHANKFQTLEAVDDGGVVVESDYRVTLNFSEPFAPILIYLTPDLGNAGAIASERALEELGRDQYGITPVSTGPFEIVEHELGSTMVLDAHDGYHKTDADGNQLPYLDGIDLEPLQEPTTRVNALRTGDVQMINWVPDTQASNVESSDETILESTIGPNFGGLAFNNRTEPFDDRRVRLAVAKAIDRDQFVAEALLGYGQADTGLYSPAHAWVYRDEYGDDPDQKPRDQLYAPEEARALAEEAGATGVSVEMISNQSELRQGQVAADMLEEELNWDVSINQLDITTIFERMQQGNFQFAPFGNSVAPDPDELTYAVFGPPGETFNWWGPYVNDELISLVRQQRQQLGREQRKETLWAVEDLVIREAPWALLEHENSMAGRRDAVNNYTHFGVIHRYRDVWLTQ
jgi:peptide/nickel transport system substrate-binding protein